jgi:hypothetical protein
MEKRETNVLNKNNPKFMKEPNILSSPTDSFLGSDSLSDHESYTPKKKKNQKNMRKERISSATPKEKHRILNVDFFTRSLSASSVRSSSTVSSCTDSLSLLEFVMAPILFLKIKFIFFVK